MRLLAALALTCWTLSFGGDLTREDEVIQVGEAGSRIVTFVKCAESAAFSGAVLVAKNGAVVAAVGVGSADLDGKVLITPKTLFEIASATKQFTAAAVMRLVQNGRLTLEDTIDRHLPDVPADCREITVRHLLQHTSGISGKNSRGAGDDINRVLPAFLRGGPQHTPGTHREYWNQGYSLLSEVIARASGQSYTDYCQTALFSPARMSATCFTGDPAPEKAIVAIGRSSRGQSRSALEHPYGNYGFQYRGMGGVVTSVWDLWRWDRALNADAILNATSKAQLFKPGLNDYALGWFVRKHPQGRIVQTHGGSVRGFTCELRRFPEQNACVFVVCNHDDAPAHRIAQAVEEIVFGDSPTIKEPPAALDGTIAKSLVGQYKDAKGALLSVEADGKVTRARIKWYENGPVSRATLGFNAAGEIVLYEWSDLHKLTVDRDMSNRIKTISMFDRNFSRE